MTSRSLETFLPPADETLTLKRLLHGYGKWWMTQPSRTGYPRHYNTDVEHYLVVWEGAPGFYDHYGDFEDDHRFYNHVVRGDMVFFDISLKQDKSIEVKTTRDYEPDYHGVYASLGEMRARMMTDWPQIEPTLGEQGEALKAFIAKHTDQVIALFEGYGDQWTQAAPDKKRHSLVYAADREIYLCAWEGAANAVQAQSLLTPDDPDLADLMTSSLNWAEILSKQKGTPRIDQSRMSRYDEVKIIYLRVPVRFELTQRRWSAEWGSAPHFRTTTQDKGLRTFQALAEWPILEHLLRE